MNGAIKKKTKKSVDGSLKQEIVHTARRKQGVWRLTEFEQMGKVFEMTDKSFTVNGSKEDVLKHLRSMGKVESAKELLIPGEIVCSCRTVDAYRVKVAGEWLHYLAEKI